MGEPPVPLPPLPLPAPPEPPDVPPVDPGLPPAPPGSDAPPSHAAPTAAIPETVRSSERTNALFMETPALGPWVPDSTGGARRSRDLLRALVVGRAAGLPRPQRLRNRCRPVMRWSQTALIIGL